MTRSIVAVPADHEVLGALYTRFSLKSNAELLALFLPFQILLEAHLRHSK